MVGAFDEATNAEASANWSVMEPVYVVAAPVPVVVVMVVVVVAIAAIVVVETFFEVDFIVVVAAAICCMTVATNMANTSWRTGIIAQAAETFGKKANKNKTHRLSRGLEPKIR